MTSNPDEFTRIELEKAGLMRWIAARDLTRGLIPAGVQGVYLAFREGAEPPPFLSTSAAGTHKGRDPTIPISELEHAWNPDCGVVYIGKAHLTATSDLQKRVWAFVRQGRGRKAGHWGGRSTWQLADGPEVLIAWMKTDDDAREVESQLLAAFIERYERLPFANMIR